MGEASGAVNVDTLLQDRYPRAQEADMKAMRSDLYNIRQKEKLSKEYSPKEQTAKYDAAGEMAAKLKEQNSKGSDATEHKSKEKNAKEKDGKEDASKEKATKEKD